VAQTDTVLYLVTPHVVPLASHLSELEAYDGLTQWGLHQVMVLCTHGPTLALAARSPRPFVAHPAWGPWRAAPWGQRALAFLTEDGSVVHGSLTLGALYLDDAMDVKVGGLDLAGALADTDSLVVVRLPLHAPSLLQVVRPLTPLVPVCWLPTQRSGTPTAYRGCSATGHPKYSRAAGPPSLRACSSLLILPTTTH
jgi:hypothetical protein